MADQVFAAGPEVARVLVRYDPWAVGRSGRRNKPAVVRAEQAVLNALRARNLAAAAAAMAGLAAVPDQGLALCGDRASLAAVLAERLRRGEVCFVDGLVHPSAVVLTAWRE